MKTIIKTADAPDPVGPYNQAVKFGNIVFTSGQIAIDPNTNRLVENEIVKQTKQVIENLGAVLKASGSSYENVIKTTVFLKDMDDFIKMNEIYQTYFHSNSPARTTVEVSRLPKDVLIEIECVAEIPSNELAK
jgi:2-iminobutanoate/2-iminopropanoate deaminase